MTTHHLPTPDFTFAEYLREPESARFKYDRGYRSGDVLVLHEWVRNEHYRCNQRRVHPSAYTGRTQRRLVTDVQPDGGYQRVTSIVETDPAEPRFNDLRPEQADGQACVTCGRTLRVEGSVFTDVGYCADTGSVVFACDGLCTDLACDAAKAVDA